MAFWPWAAARSRTARHEAAHVVVARHLGAYDLEAEVYDRPRSDGTQGHFTGMFDGSRVDEAVILAAGVAGSPGSWSPTDLARSGALLDGSEVTVGDVRRRAARLVRRNRTEIDRLTEELLA